MKNFDFKPHGLRSLLSPALRCCLVLYVLWPLSGAAAQPLDTMALLDEGPSRTLLEGKKPIYAETSGRVPVNYSQALEILQQPGFMNNVQEAYTNLIDEDGTPEFTIQQTSANCYFYVNRKWERTDITEIMRRNTSADRFDIILYSTGQRFFGNYEALIHVRVKADGEGASTYVAAVYAYPENAVSRFFARHLGLVDRYFRKKTVHMTDMITTITCSLCGQDEEVPLGSEHPGEVSPDPV